MFTLKHELETFLFIIFAIGISLLILMQRGNSTTNQRVFSATLPGISALEPTPTTSAILVTDIDSPDGKKTLTVKKQQQKDLSTTYSYATSSKSEAQKQQIFTKTEPLSQTLSVPYNTWAPDDAYFFLKESMSTSHNYFVFNASGSLFPNNAKYINVQEVFSQKLPHYTIEDVTGWAAPDLLIVNTKTEDGKQGPSFWFVISTQAFLQLGTHF